jgi:hypothetical protein
MAERHRVAVTTAADGTATAYTPDGLNGRVASITYTKTDFVDGVDFTITAEATGESLWTDTNINASETVYPVQKGNLGGTGAASTILEVPIVIANDRVKIVIAQGGNAKVGVFHVVIA